MISKLIKKEFVKKEQNENDKREKLVSLSSKGFKVLEKITPLALKRNEEIKKLISENEYISLLKILNKINDNI